MDGGVGEFAGLNVLACFFAEVVGGLRDIEQVVNNLEHEADGVGVGRNRFEERGVDGVCGECLGSDCIGEQSGMMEAAECAHATGGANQGACFVVVDGGETILWRDGIIKPAEGVVDLSGDH